MHANGHKSKISEFPRPGKGKPPHPQGNRVKNLVTSC